MTRSAIHIEKKFVEEFGNLYASYGLKRLNGMIVGLLLASEEPVSLDDIALRLGRSKGPISVAVRQLAALGLVQRVAGPENRRDYYRADDDIFYSNHKLNMRTVRRNRAIAERFLGEIREAGGDGHHAMEENLRRMHAFYTLMESFYSGFAAEWERSRNAAARTDQTQ